MIGAKNMADLRAESGIMLVEVNIKRRQLLYWGHVARMPHTRLEKQMLNGWLLPEVNRTAPTTGTGNRSFRSYL